MRPVDAADHPVQRVGQQAPQLAPVDSTHPRQGDVDQDVQPIRKRAADDAPVRLPDGFIEYRCNVASEQFREISDFSKRQPRRIKEIRHDCRPVYASERFSQTFCKGFFVELNDDILCKVHQGLKFLLNQFSNVGPFDASNKSVQRLGQRAPQRRPVDAPIPESRRVYDGVQPLCQRRADVRPVDAGHKAVNRAGDALHDLGDLAADVAPRDQRARLVQRAVYLLCDHAAQAVPVFLGHQRLDLLDKVLYARRDGRLLEADAGGRAAPTAAAAAGRSCRQDVQLVKARELPLEFLHAAAAAFGVLVYGGDSLRHAVSALPGQGREEHAQRVGRLRDNVDQRGQRGRYGVQDGRERRGACTLQAVQRGAQRRQRRLHARVILFERAETFLDGAAKPVEQHKQRTDAQSVLQ